jgi:Transglycosylase SLT domain
MVKGIIAAALLLSVAAVPSYVCANDEVNPYAIPICAAIINEMTEGRISLAKAKEISLAIAYAGNKHFGKVTCGDMWLYMAIVHVESGFKNNIINYQNCRGMFQVHAPSWASKFGLKYADLLDLQTNADCGVAVFKYYLETYKTLVAALSAYNSDHPKAATGYAWAVLGTRKKTKRRYTELYREYKALAALSLNTWQEVPSVGSRTLARW